MRTKFLFLLSFFLLALAHAHSGFNTLAWQETWGDYTLSVLEDFHTDPKSEAQLFVQLSQGNDAAPQGTTVNAVIRLKNELIYKGALAFIANGSSDGKTFYANYLLTLPLEQDGMYEVAISASGPLGTQKASYLVQSRQDSVSVLGALPSLVIALISLGGVALLFLPNKRKDVHYENQTVRFKSAHPHRS